MHLPELDVIGVRLTAVFTARRPPTPVVFTALADIVIAIAIAIGTKSRSAGSARRCRSSSSSSSMPASSARVAFENKTVYTVYAYINASSTVVF
jgi:hypothetical protein